MAIIVHGVVVNEYARVYESSASERVGCFQYCRVDFCYVGLFDQDVDLAVKQEAEENFVLNTPPQLPSSPLTTDSDCTSVLGSRHGHPDTYIPGQLLYFNFRKMKHAPG